MRALTESELESVSALRRLARIVDPDCLSDADMREFLSDEGLPRSLYEMYSGDIRLRVSMSAPAAEIVDMVDDLSKYIEIEKFGARPSLGAYPLSCAYLSALFRATATEQSYVLFLSASGRLDNAVLLQKGTINRITIYMRDLALAAVRSGSPYAVLAHNHPGGFAAPSIADLRATQRAQLALKAVGCALLDHIIVTDALCVSIRRNGKLDDGMWDSPRCKDTLNAEWFGSVSDSDGRYI